MITGAGLLLSLVEDVVCSQLKNIDNNKMKMELYNDFI